MSFVNSVLSAFRRELLYLRSDRLYLSAITLLPIVMIAFFVVMFGGGTIEGLPIVVVDRDESETSRKLTNMVNATRGITVQYEALSMDEAEGYLLDGSAVAIIYIENGFESKIYEGVPANIESYISGASISASGVVESNVQQALRTFSAGVSLGKLQAMGVNYNQAMVDIMPINFHIFILSNPYINYAYYLAPIFMFMGVVIFTVLATVFAVGRELYYATAPEWIQSASGSYFAALIGKLLPITFAMILLMQLVYGVLFIIMGMECMGSYLMLTLASVLFIIAYQSIAAVFVIITSNMRLALSLGGGYAVMAFTFSGITFPTESMYGVARTLSHLFPLTPFSDLFIDQAMRGIPVEWSVWEMAELILFMLPVAFVWPRLRRVATDRKYFSRD